MTLIPASIKAARAEADRRWPSRSTASDGTIGDAAHASRTSDHNPDDAPGSSDNRDADRVREVHAFDLTHDPAAGVDCDVLAEHLRRRVLAGVEGRIAYIIWNKRIFNPAVSPAWRAYRGSNPHTKHMHVSIRYSTAAETDTSSWWPDAPAADRPSEWLVRRATLEGEPVALKLIRIPTDHVGDGSAPVAGYLGHAEYASTDKYDPHTADETTAPIIPVGARLSGSGVRLVVAGGPAKTDVYALALVSDDAA